MRPHPNQLAAMLWALQQQGAPMNMLAAADDGFDPDGPVARMLRAQRAADARAAALQKGATPPQPVPVPQTRLGLPAPESVLQKRLREAGLE